MHADDALLHQGAHGHVAKSVAEALPEVRRVAPLALVEEAVDAVDGRTLVVATQQEEVLGLQGLVDEEQRDALDAVLATVHVVPKEEVIP